ncbi:MAG: chorismate-binding protein [Acidobacteriota bacterium]
MSDFAFIQSSPGRIIAGRGPFRAAASRQKDAAAFFISDYFLSDPSPWKHPSHWQEMAVEDLVEAHPAFTRPVIHWQTPDRRLFQSLFSSAHFSIEHEGLKKAVPVLFENGSFEGSPDALMAWLIGALRFLPPSLRAYGIVQGDAGMIGASPEVLFEGAGQGYRTAALAGTRPIDRAEELWSDPKERDEHRMVVEDIVLRLRSGLRVDIGSTEIARLPGLAHLFTPIEASADGEVILFEEMVGRLHPTAALGVFPRCEAGRRWLKESDRVEPRRQFGAPFGFQAPDDAAICLVAIRNVQWAGQSIRIGSGGGVLAESIFENELAELKAKRDQVKSLFDLNGEGR